MHGIVGDEENIFQPDGKSTKYLQFDGGYPQRERYRASIIEEECGREVGSNEPGVSFFVRLMRFQRD